MAGLSMPLEPRDVFIKALRDREGATPDLATIMPRQIGKPLASGFLPLGEGKNVLAIGLGYVIGGADRLESPAVLAAIVPRNPGAAFGAPAIGIPSPILWGAMTAVLRFVPYVGVLLSAAFPMALAAMIDPGWWKLVETAAVFIVGDPLLGQFVEPLLFGHQTRLSPLAVLIGISFWSLLWGPVGLVLAVPLTLAIVVMGQHLPRLEFLGILLGNEPVLEPHERLYHQFLAEEASLAAKEAEHWIGEHTFENYLDEVAIPALRVAADDQKRGVLGREQFLELSETIAEYLQLVQETLEYGREQQAAHGCSQAGGGWPVGPCPCRAGKPGFGCGAIDYRSHPPRSRHRCPLCVARWADRNRCGRGG